MTFDIYTGDNFFQGDGNSFWTDVIVNCIGAFVGFTLSLLIYRHQIKRDNRKEAEAKQDTDKAQLRYFAAVADTFIKNAKKQLELLDSYIEEQKKEPSDLKSLKKVPSYDFTRLLNNDNKDVLEAWIKNINSENSVIDYRNATTSIDKTEAVMKELHRVYNVRIKTNYRLLYEVKTMVDHLPDRLASIAFELFNQLGDRRHEDPFYRMLNTQIGIYTELIEKNATIKEIMEKFVQPTLIEFFTNYRTNKYTDEIATLCKKARVKFNEAEQDMTALVSELREFKGKVSPSITIVEEFIVKARAIV